MIKPLLSRASQLHLNLLLAWGSCSSNEHFAFFWVTILGATQFCSFCYPLTSRPVKKKSNGNRMAPFANLWIAVCSGNSKPVCLSVMGITLLLNALCIFLGRVRTLCRVLLCVPTCDAWSQHHMTAVESEHFPSLRHHERQSLLLFQVQTGSIFKKRLDSSLAHLVSEFYIVRQNHFEAHT